MVNGKWLLSVFGVERRLMRVRRDATLFTIHRLPFTIHLYGSALRGHALSERAAALLGSAARGQDGSACFGRDARGVEHVHALLPVGAPRRLRLRARRDALALAARAGRLTRRAVARGGALSARGRGRRAGGRRADGQPRGVAP